jgi:hypothetical protein
MKYIPVEICISSDEERNSCHYGYWRIDSRNKRLLAVCDNEERNIEIFDNNPYPDEIKIPSWCPLEEMLTAQKEG